MSIRPKTKRRLVILLVAVLLAAGIAGALVTYRSRADRQNVMSLRTEGMAAYEQGNYPTALKHLSDYLTLRRTDAEAVYYSAMARRKVEEPNGAHLREAMGRLNIALKLRPGYLEAQRALLGLQDTFGRNVEMVDLANEILAKVPDDPEALQMKAIALLRLRKFDEALKPAQRLNEVNPLNLTAWQITFELLYQLKAPAKEVLAKAAALQQAHKDDPQFEMLLGLVHRQQGNRTEAVKWLKTAAGHTSPDAEFVMQLALVLDSMGMFGESEAMLERAAAGGNDVQIHRALIQRMWQDWRYNEVVKRLEKLDPRNDKSDSQLLGYRAMALYQTRDRRSDAAAIVQALGQRKNDPRAMAWSTALSARYGDAGQQTPASLLPRLKEAIMRDAGNPVIRYMLAEVYSRLGETDIAMQEWAKVSRQSPTWAQPEVAIARSLTALGRHHEAVEHARVAMARAPQRIAPAVCYIVALYGVYERTRDAKLAEVVLHDAGKVQNSRPEGESETLPIYVVMLARTGQRDAAIQAIEKTMRSKLAESPELMRQLLTVSRSENLGMESRILQMAGQLMTPQLALGQGLRLAQEKKFAEGLALIDAEAKKAKDSPAAWALAMSQYREATADAQAKQYWMELAKAYPDDVAVQSTVLKAASVQNERPFVAQVIKRVRALTGDEGLTWRLARARWLLGGAEGDKDIAEAVVILRDVVAISPGSAEARILLAAAYERSGNLDNAVEQMRQARDLNPGNPLVLLELGRLLQTGHRFDDARSALQQVVKVPNLSPELRRRAAAMCMDQGELELAATLLQLPMDNPEAEVARMQDLANLHRRQGKVTEAAALYAELLRNPKASADILYAAADFHASQGNFDEAQKVMARVSKATLPPGQRELVLAGYEERFVSIASARQYYVAATQAAPAEAKTWRNYIGYLLRNGHIDDALAAAEQGCKAAPTDGDLPMLRDHIKDLNTLAAWGNLAPLSTALAANPKDAGVKLVLASLHESQAAHETQAQAAERLRKVWDQHPRSLPVSEMTVRLCLSARKMEEACTIASRIMQTMPDSSKAARIATMAFELAGRWEEMQLAARTWRQRSLEQPIPADMAIAMAALRRDTPQVALEAISPHLRMAKSRPDTYAELIMLYARALLQAGRETEAADLLMPLAQQASPWRQRWLELAAPFHRNVAAASAWINRIQPIIAKESVAEQFELAQAWQHVGVRFAYEDGIKKAKDILEPLVARPDVKPEMILLLALTQQRQDDMAGAEASYRKVLQLKPDSLIALNNLACLLISRGSDKDLEEALALATRTIAADPQAAPFHDTLARVYLKLGRRADAIKEFEQAIQLSPNTIETLITFAGTLIKDGRLDDAGLRLQQIDALRRSGTALSADAKRELDAVQADWKKMP